MGADSAGCKSLCGEYVASRQSPVGVEGEADGPALGAMPNRVIHPPTQPTRKSPPLECSVIVENLVRLNMPLRSSRTQSLAGCQTRR